MSKGHSSLAQIPLQFGNFQKTDLDSFLPGENIGLLHLLHDIAIGEINHCLYLWGSSGTGKSHLLQAVCKRANEKDLHVAYIPLQQHAEFSPEMLHDLGQLDLVCIDDIEAITGQLEWQQGLTWLYNELRDNNHTLLISGCDAPAKTQIELDDLKSRLSWDQVYQIKMPDDVLKGQILKDKAKARSFDLNDEVIEFLIRRVDRNLVSLIKILDEIDHASLAAKRKITIPFVKELIKD